MLRTVHFRPWILLVLVALSVLSVVPRVFAMDLQDCFDVCRVKYHCMALPTRDEQAACIPQQEACRQDCAKNYGQ